MFFNWTVTTMCYYGLTSAAATLTPDLYLNFTLAILVEVCPSPSPLYRVSSNMRISVSGLFLLI